MPRLKYRQRIGQPVTAEDGEALAILPLPPSRRNPPSSTLHVMPASNRKEMSMPNYINEAVIAQWLCASCEFGASLDDEMKAAFYLRTAIEKIKPSNIYALAKLSNSQGHFADLLMQTCLACSMPSEAETIAADVVDSFYLNKQAASADAAWLLVLLSAAEAARPDEEWLEASATCKRVYDATTAKQTDLLSSLLGEVGTWLVPAAYERGKA